MPITTTIKSQLTTLLLSFVSQFQALFNKFLEKCFSASYAGTRQYSEAVLANLDACANIL